MRMNPDSGESAAEWLARVRVEELAGILRDYGEERYAKRIARAIVAERARRPIETTAQLAAVIRRTYPGRWGRIDPATRSFQAIRIHINQEMQQLRAALEALVDVLAAAGRAAFISFHSLEDRMVKRFLRGAGRPDPAGAPARLKIVASKVRAGDEERAANPRARSAILRVAEKLA
jgi:16S rRNA (cytosine1402-N4)-methyltransferase